MYFLGDYSFEFNNNILTLNGGALEFVSNKNYEILVDTWYLKIHFTQKIQITIEYSIEVPVVSIE